MKYFAITLTVVLYSGLIEVGLCTPDTSKDTTSDGLICYYGDSNIIWNMTNHGNVTWNYTSSSKEAITLDKIVAPHIAVTEVGLYQCYDDLGQLHGNFTVVAKPVIQVEDNWENTKHSTTYKVGDARRLTCLSKDNYFNDAQFKWFFRPADNSESADLKERLNGTSYTITKNSSASELKFLNLGYSDAGYYFCNVSHALAVAYRSAEIRLRVHPQQDWVMPLLGIFAQGVLLFIFMFVYKHNVTKKRMITTNMTSEETK